MDNFYKTALRTFKSSTTLHNSGEYFNAFYLGGYVVECYSKIVLNHAFSLSSEYSKKHFAHDLIKTTKEIEYLRQDPSVSGLIDTKYIVNLNVECQNIISGRNKWKPIKRYYDDETIWDNIASTQFQDAINIVMRQIRLMKIDGVI